jgi:hypothetical protein
MTRENIATLIFAALVFAVSLYGVLYTEPVHAPFVSMWESYQRP